MALLRQACDLASGRMRQDTLAWLCSGTTVQPTDQRISAGQRWGAGMTAPGFLYTCQAGRLQERRRVAASISLALDAVLDFPISVLVKSLLFQLLSERQVFSCKVLHALFQAVVLALQQANLLGGILQITKCLPHLDVKLPELLAVGVTQAQG
eukprot:CAMPEP_0197891258 /NCGR_PEP_ID=MMETSP1439-20131203/27792_1 /TAXON_ID=66791 /ORGANISM="Gonyaulax spinifera, Strain CCMP409" /LENGTH=152 /DNA_ID=CAMNT_0043511343 /DNA_START=51 /DNA_END=509 /DNA_ORIENTATION=-